MTLTRRSMLQQCAMGFGGVAFVGLLDQQRLKANDTPFAPQPTTLRPRAKNVIFLYMDGGPSQVDTFDPKPRLHREQGQPFGMKKEPTQFDDNGLTLASPWKFRRYGQSGIPVSDLFPNIAQHVDDLAIIRSMTSDSSVHANANYFLHTGSVLQGRPSMGAWFGYGLGSEASNLPAFVVINGGLIPPGGVDNFNSGFLPANTQASIFATGELPVANVHPLEPEPSLQRRKIDFVHELDKQHSQSLSGEQAIDAAIANYELAFRMQQAVPEIYDLSQESAATKGAYGCDSSFAPEATYAKQCLLARRLVESGVRFVELTCPAIAGADRWDQHGGLAKGHSDNARAVDRPISALLTDLKNRGMLDETLVVWSGEFGRTPFAQGKDGRDHNPFGFSLWMAGAGVRGGTVTGATDEYGYKAVENVRRIHDLHATMLHLLGIDHKLLTYRFGGRDMRLTDVHGELITELLS